jgi:F-type H+-transporting ATPase subunit delta
MLELVRGYAAATFDAAERDGVLDDVVSGLDALRGLVVSSEPLRLALTDGSFPSEARAEVMNDLLETRVRPEVVALATFPVIYERAAELPKTYEQLALLASDRAQQAEAGSRAVAEPPAGRSGALERLRGFAERTFETLDDQATIDEIEDDLFRFARLSEQYGELRAALGNPQTPLAERLAVLESLLAGKVRPETLQLVQYVIRGGRARDIVGTLDYLVELAAFERGRRVAEVRAAVELDESERERLKQALSRRTRRNVELRVILDPTVLGGLGVTVGDTVIDGTLRHRLDQLRDVLLQPST